MSEIQVIQSALERTARRLRWQNGWKSFWKGFLYGSAVWLVALVLFKWLPLPFIFLETAGMLGLAVALGGFAIGWVRQPSLKATARWVDEKRHLQERLSTALELDTSSVSGDWQELVIRDAAQHAHEIKARELLPFRLPWASRWVVLILALGAGLGFIPEHRSPQYVQRQHDAQVIKETGHILSELTRRSIEQRKPVLEPTQKALEQVAELGDQFTKARLTREDALKDLANVTEKLKEQSETLAKSPGLRAMERAARDPNGNGTPSTAALQKQIESLQKALQEQAKGASDNKLQQLANELKKAQEAAAGLPNGNSADADAAREQLQKSLSNLARQAKDLGINLPSLDEAIAALAASQTDQMLKDMATAEIQLEKLQAMAKALAQLQAQAEKLGKDLPEQLQNGQAEAAQATLQKMSETLKSEKIDAEELKKIADELARSIDPAGQYGKVAELLKQGDAQLKAGQKADAAQSLADAAKELENLMQQLGDGKAILASLEALQQAQMCVGNGQCWSLAKPRASQGGGRGRGVGTWADDSKLLDMNDIKESWDNSGVRRPDMQARGVSDRGDAQLADSLLPTKIKGQMNPGAPMPSITLKGLSIKGQSKVDFTEMATAAQAEAQAALSQEKIPRAYQSAVRDYFDDLKK